MRTLRILVAVAMLLPAAALSASSAGAAGSGTTCTSFSGKAALSPGLPMLGSTQRVTPTFSLKHTKLAGCHGTVTAGTASGTLRFGKPSNCTLWIKQVTANVASKAQGTINIAWSNRKTSKLAFAVSFGTVTGKPSLAKVSGKITAGLFKGMTGSGTVMWSLGTDECFGGAPLTSLTFTAFAPFVTK